VLAVGDFMSSVIDEGGYGRFGAYSRVELERFFHLDDEDRRLIEARRRDYNRLGFFMSSRCGISAVNNAATTAPTVNDTGSTTTFLSVEPDKNTRMTDPAPPPRPRFDPGGR